MCEVWSVLLLLWGCMCFHHSPAHGALVISRSDDDPLTQETKGFVGARSIKKRSINHAKVEVDSVTVDCTVASRFAHTVMTSTALNKANSSQEIFYEVELPKTAFITNFSMEIDGQVYVGEVKEKEKAKKQYDKAVSSGQTAGLVKASGRKMEKFSVSVNIAANNGVTFTLIYEELLQRKLGQYEILIRVTPKQLVHKLQVVANIYEPQGIAYVDAYGTFLSNELLPAVEKTVSDTKAHISFSPTLEQQRKCPGCDGTLIDGDFIIKYDVKRATSLGHVQIVNGYFVHFFAPPDLPRVPKNVVFVIDRSGSMSGTKMKQTQDAMVAILKDLHEDDHLGLVQFDDSVLTWKESLTQATKRNVAKALTYAKKIKAKGGTDINDAVLTAVKMLVKDRQDQKLPERSADMIILLTDGLPNSGESRLPKIQENVRGAVDGKMSLFCLGFGDNVDYSFLDVMAKQNKGLARRIYEASDASIQLQGFYEEVASTLLLEVDLRYPDNTVDSLTNSHFTQLFNGSEIVVAGRLSDNDMDNFMVEVFAKGSQDDFQVEGQATAVDWNVVYPEKEYIFEDFTERMWAYITIQQLLEQSEIGTEPEKSNATAKALDMSLKYGFVTPLTSLVVTKPDREDGPSGPLIAEKLTEDQRQKAQRKVAGSPRTFSSHTSHKRLQSPHSSAASQSVDGDPHFMIELPEQEDALCFDINHTPGTVFNLVRDSTSGFWVNGEIIGKKKVAPDGKTNTYFGRFGIVHRTLGVRLEVTTEDISVSQDGQRVTLLWSDTAALHGPNMNLNLTKHCALTVTLKDSVKFKVVLHTRVWKKLRYRQDYLGFYTLDAHLLSQDVHGLLGQFYHGVEFEVGDLRPGEVPEKPDATMYVKGQQLNVTRHYERDFHRDVKNGVNVPCWFIHSNGTGLIDGDASAYIVSGLFNTI